MSSNPERNAYAAAGALSIAFVLSWGPARSDTVAPRQAPTAPAATMPAAQSSPDATTQQLVSATNRVGVIYVIQTTEMNNEVNRAVFQRLSKDYAQVSDFTAVPIDGGMSVVDSYNPWQICRANHVNALIYTLSGGSVGGDSSGVHTSTRVVDCSGAIVFYKRESKSAWTTFNFKNPTSIAKDLGTDLAVDEEREFAAFRQTNSGIWSSLMQTGVAADPTSSDYLSLVHFYRDEVSKTNAAWRITHVFPGGPADVAGLREDDAIDSIDGTSVTAVSNLADLTALINKPSYTIAIHRPGQDLTIEVHAKQYAELLAMIRKPAIANAK